MARLPLTSARCSADSDRRLVDVKIESAGRRCLDRRLGDALHDAVVLAADRRSDPRWRRSSGSCDFGEAREIGHARHRAVVVHHFADDGRGIEARQLREIDRRFGMAGADEDAAFAGDQRKDVSRRDDIGGTFCRIDGGRNRARPIERRNAGRDAFARLDRLREGGAIARAVACAP